jgi:hypothetical protein
LGNLIRKVSDTFRLVPDKRRQSHCLYEQHDFMMAALSCIFFQEPSWLQFQTHLQEGLHDNNLSTLFHIGKIPQETQVRDILDNLYYIAVDGSCYHTSKTVHCEHCLTKKT